MGHNPLGSHPLAGAKLDFIPNTSSGSEANEEKKKSKKKVVSYYLDEEIIQEIKDRAKERDQSYSQYLSTLLDKTLK